MDSIRNLEVWINVNGLRVISLFGYIKTKTGCDWLADVNGAVGSSYYMMQYDFTEKSTRLFTTKILHRKHRIIQQKETTTDRRDI